MRRNRTRRAFDVEMLTSVVFELYPHVLPATDAARSLTVHNGKAAEYGLRIRLIWWATGMVLCTGYFVFLYRYIAGKVKLDADYKGY